MNEEAWKEAAQWRHWQCAPASIDFPLESPFNWGLIEVWREGWAKTEVVEPHKLHPEFNVYGLYWRPWPLVHPRWDGP